MLTRKLFFPLLLLLLLPPSTGMAQTAVPDTVYVFRFVSHNDMFYVPWKGNDMQLNALLSLVETHKTAILNGNAPLLVDGYCSSEPAAAENLKLAKIRSNRVKSELIMSKGISESCFTTRNHAEPYGDFRQAVTVRLRLPKTGAETNANPNANPNTIPNEESPTNVETAVKTPSVTSQETPKQETPADIPTSTDASSGILSPFPPEASRPYHLTLRANLLHWATLTPDLGIEWRVNRHLGILVNGSWTSWSWDNKNRRYALWQVSPEVRYYMGGNCRGFLGLMYHTGEFHYKLGDTGRQGDYQGGGLTGGYLLNLSRSLSFDFHAAAGYTRADYDKYVLTDNVRVRRDSKTRNYWGINGLGITLVWKLIK